MTTTITQPQARTDAWETDDPAYKYDAKDYVKNLKVTAGAVISIYRVKGTPQAFKEYYEGTIVPWLDGNKQNWRNAKPTTSSDNPKKQAPYVVEVYLIGDILIVVCINSYQPWETIANLFDHIEKVNAEQLPWVPKPAKNTQLEKSA